MEYKQLGDLATYINGYPFKPEDRGTEGLPIIRIQDLTGNAYDLGFYNGDYPKRIEINDGDVLISWSASLGVYIWTRGKALLNQHIFKVVFDKATVNKQYFVLAVQHKLKEMESKTHGATMKHIVKKDFDNTEIPFPPLDRQAEIADTLSRAKRIIDARQQQLNVLDDLIKARFVEMFGDPEINPMCWPIKTLDTLLSIEPQNGLYKPQSDYVQDGSGTPILRIDAFYDGRVTSFLGLKRLQCSEAEKSRYLLKENDIVINRVNSLEYLGKCAWITGMVEPTVFESNMMRFHVNESEIDPCFLTRLLCSSFVYNQILNRAKKAVNQASINQSDVQSFRIIVPPINLQTQFATFVAQIDKSKSVIQKTLDETQLLFDSLMQKYFG